MNAGQIGVHDPEVPPLSGGNLRTTARRDGDTYVVNGEKTFITSGMRADHITTASARQ